MDAVIEWLLVIGIVIALADRVWTWVKKQRAAPAEGEASVALATPPKKKMLERDYQDLVVAQLEAAGLDPHAEVVLDDGARIDVATKTHAIEIDFPHKWAECVGQALYYGLKTGKAPVCLLVVNREKGEPGVMRCAMICRAYRVQLWLFDAETLTLQR